MLSKLKFARSRTCGILFPIPAGIVPDTPPAGANGLFGLMQAINEDAWTYATFSSSSQTPTIPAASIVGSLSGVLQHSGAPGGAVTVTLDSAANIDNVLPGFVSFMAANAFQTKWRYMNSTGQAVTISTSTGWTLNGTMTVANGAWRDFLIIFTGTPTAPAFTLQNIGGGTI